MRHISPRDITTNCSILENYRIIRIVLLDMKIQSLLHRQGGRCFYCRKPLAISDASIEHVIPQAMGFFEGFQNLVACCRDINSLFQELPPKHKIEMILNAGGMSICPKDLELNYYETLRRNIKLSSSFNEPLYGSGSHIQPQSPPENIMDINDDDDVDFLQDFITK